MKKLILTILILTSFKYITGQSTLPNTGDPTLPVVHDLSYDVSTKTYYKVQEGITWEDINPLDLVGLYPRESVENHHFTIDGDGDPITVKSLLSQKDMYPPWTTYYELTRYGSDGITNQVYANKVSDNDLYFSMDSEEASLLETMRWDIQQNGYLNGYVYKMPSSDDIDFMNTISDQIEWSDDGNLMSCIFDTRIEEWDNKNLRKKSESPLDDGGRIRITHYYKMDVDLNLPLLNALVVERFMNLTNGICVTEVNIESYTNYQFEIKKDSENGAGLRSTSNLYMEPMFNLYPNPLRGDLINLQMQPDMIGQQVIMQIIDANGVSLHSVQRTILDTQETIRLSGSQYAAGLYFLILDYNGSRTSQPFFISK